MYALLFGALALVPFFMDDAFTLNQFARYGVFALLAVSVSLVWGFGGILSLGQGIAFGMAAYCMGATMQMQSQDPVNDPIPSFMLTNELSKLPVIWEPFWNTGVGLVLAIVLPTAFFLVFGYMMFKGRLAGPSSPNSASPASSPGCGSPNAAPPPRAKSRSPKPTTASCRNAAPSRPSSAPSTAAPPQ